MTGQSFETRLEAWAGSPVRRITRPSAGYSNETVVVDLADGRRLVLRLPPEGPESGGLFPDYDLGLQAAVLTLAATHGVPVPHPVTLEEDPGWLGRPFLVMPFVEGHVLGEAPSLDPWLTELGATGQARLHDRFLELLAEVHRLRWEDGPLGARLRSGGLRSGGLGVELEWWERYVAWVAGSDEVPPVLEAGMAWCRAHQPDEPPASLLWGDVRLGNVVAGFEGEEPVVRALLDWEMATAGPAESDLGWYLALDEVTTRFIGRPPGFPGRQEITSRFAEHLGRALSHLGWHETFALVRALAVNWRQQRLRAARRRRPAPPVDRRHPVAGLLEERIGRTG